MRVSAGGGGGLGLTIMQFTTFSTTTVQCRNCASQPTDLKKLNAKILLDFILLKGQYHAIFSNILKIEKTLFA